MRIIFHLRVRIYPRSGISKMFRAVKEELLHCCDRMALGRKTEKMPTTRRYAELTKADALIHKSVGTAVRGLVDFLSAERKRVPNDSSGC